MISGTTVVATLPDAADILLGADGSIRQLDYCMSSPDKPDDPKAMADYVQMVDDTANAWLRNNAVKSNVIGLSSDVPAAMRQAMRAVWPGSCSSRGRG